MFGWCPENANLVPISWGKGGKNFETVSRIFHLSKRDFPDDVVFFFWKALGTGWVGKRLWPRTDYCQWVTRLIDPKSGSFFRSCRFFCVQIVSTLLCPPFFVCQRGCHLRLANAWFKYHGLKIFHSGYSLTLFGDESSSKILSASWSTSKRRFMVPCSLY